MSHIQRGKMKKIALSIALTATIAACSSSVERSIEYLDPPGDISDVWGPSSNPKRIGANIRNPGPPETYKNQWYTTPDKCSYSRAQQKGHPANWILIQNPHHIGQPNAHRGCPIQL